MSRVSSRGRRVERIAVLAVLVGVATSTGARADEREREEAKLACAQSAEDAQQLRMDGKLVAAHARLLACARPACPAPVLRDCSAWLSEVETLLPTVVLGARDAHGHDVLSAQVSIDGVVVSRGLDGKAIAVDPGAHTFHFEAAGATADESVLIREGEKGRVLTGILAGGLQAPSPPPPLEPASTTAPVSPWTWVLGGVGVVALGVGGYLELSVNSDASSLQSRCGHDCSHSQVDPLVLKQQVLGPIAFGVGALSLGVAAYLLLTRAEGAQTPTTGSLTWDLAPSGRGLVGGVSGAF